MSDSVYRRVLGADLDLLHAELRNYFIGGQGVGVGCGVFEVAGSPLRILKPLFSHLAWQRILFPEYARHVPFDVVNTTTADGDLGAVRLRSPLIGEWFRYAGHFSYRYEGD